MKKERMNNEQKKVIKGLTKQFGLLLAIFSNYISSEMLGRYLHLNICYFLMNPD